jgi:ribonuclease P protein component
MAPPKPAPLPPRLKQRAEFLAVAKGTKAPVGGLVLQILPRNDQSAARLGFTVTKKVGNAVVRNRTRRRLKEAARLVLAETPVVGHDLVLVGRASTRGRPFPALMDDLRQALRRGKALQRPHAADSPTLLNEGRLSDGQANAGLK